MSAIDKKTINNVREFLSRGCDYAGTQEHVNELTTEVLKTLNVPWIYGDEALIDECVCVEDFANAFWDRAVESFLNVLETEEE